jgi:hypothetical protein
MPLLMLVVRWPMPRSQVLKDEEGALALKCYSVAEGLIYPEQVSGLRASRQAAGHAASDLAGGRRPAAGGAPAAARPLPACRHAAGQAPGCGALGRRVAAARAPGGQERRALSTAAAAAAARPCRVLSSRVPVPAEGLRGDALMQLRLQGAPGP